MKILALMTAAFLITSCGDVEVVAPESEDSTIDLSGDPKKEETAAAEPLADSTNGTNVNVNVEVNVNIDAEVNSRGSKSETIFKLEHINPMNKEFVSDNYCKGSHVSNCWIRSGVAKRFEDGSYYVSIEFWDDSKAMPYSVTSEIINEDQAFKLTDSAKILDDQDTLSFKPLYAVMSLSGETLTMFYDYENNGVGLGGQGDQELETLNWVAQ